MVNMLEKQNDLVKSAVKQLHEFINIETKATNDQTFIMMHQPTAAQVKKARKKMIDPNKPKRSPSGYHLFMSVHTNAYKEANPEKNQTEVMTVIAKKWTESTEEEKTVYLMQAATLKAEYEQKLKTYNESRRLINDPTAGPKSSTTSLASSSSSSSSSSTPSSSSTSSSFPVSSTSSSDPSSSAAFASLDVYETDVVSKKRVVMVEDGGCTEADVESETGAEDDNTQDTGVLKKAKHVQ